MSIATTTAPTAVEPEPYVVHFRPTGWHIGAEPITFTEGAGPDLAGKTELRWYATAPDGRKAMSGYVSRDEILARVAEEYEQNRETVATFIGSHGRNINRRPPVRVRDRALGLNAHGLTVCEQDGLTYTVTPCCFADVTGSMDGVACRGCYGDAPEGWEDVTVVAPRKTHDLSYLDQSNPKVTTWLDKVKKGRYQTKTHREWLTGLENDQETSKEVRDGKHYLVAAVGFHFAVPQYVYDAANVPTKRVVFGPSAVTE